MYNNTTMEMEKMYVSKDTMTKKKLNQVYVSAAESYDFTFFKLFQDP